MTSSKYSSRPGRRNIDRKTTTAETHLSVVRPVDRPNEARRDVERADDDEEGGGCLPRHGDWRWYGCSMYVPPCGLLLVWSVDVDVWEDGGEKKVAPNN